MFNNSDFMNFFTNIVSKDKNIENEPFKPTYEALMKRCVNELNEIVEYYQEQGVYVVNAERGKNDRIKCNFKIIGKL